MTAIDDCRELGLLPEEVELYVKGCATVPWVEHVEKKYADAVLEALAAVVVEQTGEIERLEKTFDELDSWDGHLRWLEKWYPASIFGAPGDVPKNPLDTGCSNVILTRALAAEKARADRAEARLTGPIVCLCGSTKFKAAFRKAEADFALAGVIVLSVGLFGHADNVPLDVGQKAAQDYLHRRKIRLASVVYVLNVGGYIGESTANEIAYAESLGKVVSYLEPILARRTTPSQSGGE